MEIKQEYWASIKKMENDSTQDRNEYGTYKKTKIEYQRICNNHKLISYRMNGNNKSH